MLGLLIILLLVGRAEPDNLGVLHRTGYQAKPVSRAAPQNLRLRGLFRYDRTAARQRASWHSLGGFGLQSDYGLAVVDQVLLSHAAQLLNAVAKRGSLSPFIHVTSLRD